MKKSMTIKRSFIYAVFTSGEHLDAAFTTREKAEKHIEGYMEGRFRYHDLRIVKVEVL